MNKELKEELLIKVNMVLISLLIALAITTIFKGKLIESYAKEIFKVKEKYDITEKINDEIYTIEFYIHYKNGKKIYRGEIHYKKLPDGQNKVIKYEKWEINKDE